MKKLLIMTVLSIMLLGSIPAHAESHGSSFVSYLRVYYVNAQNHNYYHIQLSNITDYTITCTVKPYDAEGNDLTGNVDIMISSGSLTSQGTSLGTSATFSIPPHGTRVFRLTKTTNSNIQGYALIKWECENDNIGEALLGSIFEGIVSTNSGSAAYCLLINNGQPF